MSLLTWALIAFVVSLIAGAMGFTRVARGSATIAKWLFGIFLALAALLLLAFALGIGAVT